TGATGNVGTSLLQSLVRDPQIDSIVAIARRPPDLPLPKVTWARVDITRDDLITPFSGADAVVHLAWRIQPMRDVRALAAAKIVGSGRVFDAVSDAKVDALVYASSVGAYTPAAKQYTVDEMWPTNGIASSEYSWQKAYVERVLDAFELANPDVRV